LKNYEKLNIAICVDTHVSLSAELLHQLVIIFLKYNIVTLIFA